MLHVIGEGGAYPNPEKAFELIPDSKFFFILELNEAIAVRTDGKMLLKVEDKVPLFEKKKMKIYSERIPRSSLRD